jgi:hypothetical protein
VGEPFAPGRASLPPGVRQLRERRRPATCSCPRRGGGYTYLAMVPDAPGAHPSEDQEEGVELGPPAGGSNCQNDAPSDGEADAHRRPPRRSGERRGHRLAADRGSTSAPRATPPHRSAESRRAALLGAGPAPRGPRRQVRRWRDRLARTLHSQDLVQHRPHVGVHPAAALFWLLGSHRPSIASTRYHSSIGSWS